MGRRHVSAHSVPELNEYAEHPSIGATGSAPRPLTGELVASESSQKTEQTMGTQKLAAVNEIRSAIDTLKTLSSAGAPDKRHASDTTLPSASAELIDAQIAVLAAAEDEEHEAADYWASVGKPHLRGPAKVIPINRAALALARAINASTAP